MHKFTYRHIIVFNVAYEKLSHSLTIHAHLTNYDRQTQRLTVLWKVWIGLVDLVLTNDDIN